jgi:hypothetical protein
VRRFATLLAAAFLVAAPAAAQQGAAPLGPEYSVNDAALFGADAAARDAEIARFLAAPDRMHPFTYVDYAIALFEAGRANEARVWYMRGYLRLLVDMRFLDAATHASGLGDFPYFYRLRATQNDGFAAFMDNADARARYAAVEDAAAWEQATPRNYDMVSGPLAHALESTIAALQGQHFARDLPASSQAMLAEQQRIVIAEMRADLAAARADEVLIDEADDAIAAGRPAREAVEAVAETDRASVAPLRSVRLACTGEAMFVHGQALSDKAGQAALACAENGARGYQIVDLASGRALQESPAQGFAEDGAFAYADKDDVVLVARRGYRAPNDPPGMAGSAEAPLWAMRAGAPLAPLALPPARGVNPATHEADTYDIAVSPSGRMAFVRFQAQPRAGDPNWRVDAVYDVARRRLLWSATQAAPAQGAVETTRLRPAFIDEGRRPALIAQLRELTNGFMAPAALARVNLGNGDIARTPWPAQAADALPEPFDAGRALLALDATDAAPARYALIDLARRRETWRGDEPPARRIDQPLCEPITARGEDGSERAGWRLRRKHGAAIAIAPARGNSQCAVSADGRTLALLIAPFVHLYAIAR